MSRVRNAGEFLHKYQRVRFQFEEEYRKQIEVIRAEYAQRSAKSDIAQANEPPLEHHLREYFLNPFLEALNWRIQADEEGGQPNLIPESPIASLVSERILFLDYFGIERNTTKEKSESTAGALRWKT